MGAGGAETTTGTGAGTGAAGTTTGGGTAATKGEGGGEFGRGTKLAANLSPRTARQRHPHTGSQTLSIWPEASVDLTSRNVSYLPSAGKYCCCCCCCCCCRGGDRREPGRAHSGTGGGDRDRARARARRSRRGSEEEGEDGAVCGPAAGTEEEEEEGGEAQKSSCSQASHPRRVKTARKKRNAILAKICDGMYVCVGNVWAGERREGTGEIALYILDIWELQSWEERYNSYLSIVRWIDKSR